MKERSLRAMEIASVIINTIKQERQDAIAAAALATNNSTSKNGSFF